VPDGEREVRSKGKTMRRIHQYWLSGSLLGIVFACSGDPEVGKNSDIKGANGGSSGDGQGGSIQSSGGTVSVSGGSSNNGGENSDPNGDAGSEGQQIEDAGLPDVTFDYDPEGTGDEDACAVVEGEATLVKKPIDIIISIDNSGSMEGEIAAVQDRINNDFATIIEDADVDYRVIMVSRYGSIDNNIGSSDFPLCISAPLGAGTCADPDTEALANNSPIFFHYSADIESKDMWCRILDGYGHTDEGGAGARATGEPHSPWTPLFPNGFGGQLREEAFKVILGISDDGLDCNPPTYNEVNVDFTDDENDDDTYGFQAAQDFDRVLRALAPNQFGTYDSNDPASGRNYRYYAIVGLSSRADNAGTANVDERRIPWNPDDPIVSTTCNGPGGGDANGVAPGYAHQQLAKLTGGLRYSNCLNDDFDAMFEAVAEGVIEGSKTSCEYDVPVPEGGIVDLDETKVTYIPGDGGADVALTRAADEAACSGGAGFYFNETLDKLFLCPSSCTTVQDDDAAKLNIDFGCLGS
jgi:hypothetical protein